MSYMLYIELYIVLCALNLTQSKKKRDILFSFSARVEQMPCILYEILIFFCNILYHRSKLPPKDLQQNTIQRKSILLNTFRIMTACFAQYATHTKPNLLDNFELSLLHDSKVGYTAKNITGFALRETLPLWQSQLKYAYDIPSRREVSY